MAVIIISILLSSLVSTVLGQGSVSYYWIGVTGLPLSCKMPLCLLDKGHPFLKMPYCHIVKNVINKNKFTVSMM